MSTDYAAKQAARKVIAEALHQTHKHLIPVNGQCPCVTAAKNIRIELKAAFPGIKFRVNTRKFSMGDAIDVRWTDGPTSDMVDIIINKYSGGSFDGMTDLYTYDDNAWISAFGEAKYVHAYRDFSDEFIARGIEYVQRKYGGKTMDATVAAYKSGALWSIRWSENSVYTDNLQSLISTHLAKRAACLPVAA